MATQSVATPAPTRPQSWLPLAAVAVTVVMWASAFVAIRHLADELSAGPLTLGRILTSSLLLGAMLAVQRRRAARTGRTPVSLRPDRSAWPRLAIIGVSWFCIYHVALNQAVHYVDAGTAAMLVNIGPILIAITAGLMLGEGFPRPLLTGCAVAFGGVVIIALSTSSGFQLDWRGVSLCLAAAVTYAISVVAQKPLLADIPALQLTWLVCAIGAIVSLPFAPALWSELADAPASTWLWLLYLAAGPTALAFTTWAYALTHTSAGKLGASTYAAPPVTILIGWITLGEVPPWLAFAGGALCLAGVSISRRRPRG